MLEKAKACMCGRVYRLHMNNYYYHATHQQNREQQNLDNQTPKPKATTTTTTPALTPFQRKNGQTLNH